MAEWTGEEAQAFGDALVRLRDSHGVSQQWLGDKLGVTRALVGQWENGETEPPRRQVFAIEVCFKLRAGTLSRLLGYLPAEARPARTVPQVIDADPVLDERGPVGPASPVSRTGPAMMAAAEAAAAMARRDRRRLSLSLSSADTCHCRSSMPVTYPASRINGSDTTEGV